jgi:ligand-binding sensor domain-containing protein/signal transduction histidine kinase
MAYLPLSGKRIRGALVFAIPLHKQWYLTIVLLLLILFLPFQTHGERLPLKSYTVADGLPHNVINKIVRDSRGFLWFCTQEGLSRFDGYSFTNYGTAQGLPHPNVNDLLETRGGDYWVATNAGLIRFDPKGAPTNSVIDANESRADVRAMFTVVLPEDSDRHARAINVLHEGHDGTLWCGTYKGLYRLDSSGGRLALIPVDIGMPNEYGEWRLVTDLVEDASGSLWVATHGGLYRRWADGLAARYTKREGLPDDLLHDLLIDHQGQLWVGSRYAGFFRMNLDETHAAPKVAFTLAPHDFEQSEWINQLFETSEHKLWAATAQGLLEFIPEGDAGHPYRLYTPKNGLSSHNVSTLGEDAGGNLWLGSSTGTGAMKLARSGFVTYDEQDGVNSVLSVFADRAGGVCFRGYVLGDKRASIFDGGRVDLLNLSEAAYWLRFGRFYGQRLTWFMPDALKDKSLGWVSEGVTLQARQSGEWWIANGLYHFPAADNFTQLKTARPLAYFGKDSLLGPRQIWRMFADSRERIWVSIIDSAGNGLALWERETQTLRDLTGAANLPSPHDDLARAFGEDRAGNVWIGFNTGLARFRDGAFTFFTAHDGLPPGGITDIYADHEGKLWLASSRGGLVRVDDPESSRPSFTIYTAQEGLSSNVVLAIAEDAYGRIFVATGQGLDRLDPATGRVKHYTTADGLAAGEIRAAFRASDGWLWVGTTQGLSRFLPEREQPSLPPPVLLTGLQVAGAAQQVSALGEAEMRLPDLAASASQLQIDFVGLGFGPGESLRYQYMLEGADKDWGPPTAQRTVTYARLASGRYRFLVRAVNADGQMSSSPAVLTFRVLPPVWARWWFIVLVLLATGGATYALYRYRVARLLEVANMRTRIATDLHDDIGANLTKIAILSEVAKQQQLSGDGKDDSPLSSIARISRESVASMNDIVWAIDPQRDHLIDLVRRMRREAEELFTARDIKLTFQAPGEEQDLRLGVDVRRDLFLIFKEAINNAARHSQCKQVTIDFRIDPPRLTLQIADDGIGFDPSTDSDGHGLENMRQRAEALAGDLTIRTGANEGTTIRLKVPYTRSRRLSGEKHVGHPV